MARAVFSKTSVTIEAEGTAFFSSTIPSSTLPDEQDPQSPTPGDHRVAALAQLLDDLLVRRDRRVVLAEHARLGDAVLLDSGSSPIFSRSRSELNFVLSIRPTRLPSSVAGRSTYCDRLRRDLRGWIEKLDHRLTSLVTASEERLPPQPGMWAENGASPPARRDHQEIRRRTPRAGASSSRRPAGRHRACCLVRLRWAMEFCVCSNRNCADLRLAPAALRDRPHVLARDHDHVLRLPAHRYRRDRIVVGERGEHALRRARELVVELVRGLGGHHRDRALLRPEPALHVERRPRALRLVLGDHVGHLAGMTEGPAVEQPRAASRRRCARPGARRARW